MSFSEQQFWSVIDVCRSKDEPEETLRTLLEGMSGHDFMWFHHWLRKTMYSGYTSTLHSYAAEWFGGCSNDSFIDLRLWMISQGQGVFDTLVQDPKRLNEHFDRFGYAAPGFVDCCLGIATRRSDELGALYDETSDKESLPPFTVYPSEYVDRREG